MAKKKTRGGGTLSEAEYWSKVRSALRRQFRYWPLIKQAKLNSRIPYVGEKNARQKWVYQCAHCKRYFKEKEVQVDHVVEVGPLNRLEDLPAWLERLTSEDIENYQVLCKPCHQNKTNKARTGGKKSN